jgi:hypothetical protein
MSHAGSWRAVCDIKISTLLLHFDYSFRSTRSASDRTYDLDMVCSMQSQAKASKLRTPLRTFERPR